MSHQAFEVDFTDPGDDLLDWEQYSKSRSVRFLGREWSWTPPAWWFTLTRGQRKAFLSVSCCLLSFITLILLVALGSAAVTGMKGWSYKDASETVCSWKEWRLPPGITPSRYNLTLQLDMQPPWVVNGTVDIAVDLSHASRCIVLHASDMDIFDASVESGSLETALHVSRKRFRDDLEQLVLEWDERIPSGMSTLHVDFQYELKDGMSGLYRSTHSLPDGTTSTLAATQFEANSARTAFPCFDEPSFKAMFEIEVRTNDGLTVLSNMPPLAMHHHEHDVDDLRTWHFAPTPPMSTYLVAIIIGNLTSIDREVPPSSVPWPSLESVATTHAALDGDDGKSLKISEKVKQGSEVASSGVVDGEKIVVFGPPTTFNGSSTRRISVWGTVDRIDQLEFAADVAVAVMKAYESSLGVPYALPKLDLVSFAPLW